MLVLLLDDELSGLVSRRFGSGITRARGVSLPRERDELLEGVLFLSCSLLLEDLLLLDGVDFLSCSCLLEELLDLLWEDRDDELLSDELFFDELLERSCLLDLLVELLEERDRLRCCSAATTSTTILVEKSSVTTMASILIILFMVSLLIPK